MKQKVNIWNIYNPFAFSSCHTGCFLALIVLLNIDAGLNFLLKIFVMIYTLVSMLTADILYGLEGIRQIQS